jgi:uncharacterized membrane protein YkvA (DUF1232 family)
MPPVKDVEKRFLSTLSAHLVSLPFDLKVLYEASVDPNLEREALEVATGAILYIISPNDIISDKNEAIGFTDDVIMLRLALKHIGGSESAAGFRERFAEVYEKLDEDLKLYEDFFGDIYTWLASKVPLLPKQIYKSKTVKDYLDDDEASSFLYEVGLSFTTDYRITERSLEGRLKRTDHIVELLKRRRAEEAKRIA